MKPVKQRVCDQGYGDCFAACMASLLELPIEVVPNDHSPNYWFVWEVFLKQFGLAIEHTVNNDGAAIWSEHPWIASVKSKNFKDTSHAIILHKGGKVMHDPSTKKKYKTGTSLFTKDGAVDGATTIVISDLSKVHKLEEYRQKLNPDKT